MFAALADYPDCIEILLKHGAKSTAKDRSGRSALHWSAHHGHSQCLKILMNHASKKGGGIIDGKGSFTGSKVWKEPDQGGVTILHLSTRNPETKCLNLVLKQFNIGPADINIAVSDYLLNNTSQVLKMYSKIR